MPKVTLYGVTPWSFFVVPLQKISRETWKAASLRYAYIPEDGARSVSTWRKHYYGLILKCFFMEQEKEKVKNEDPFVEYSYLDEMGYFPYLKELSRLDETWLRSMNCRYPQVNLLRHFWNKVFYQFMQHIAELEDLNVCCQILCRALRPPRRKSVAWYIRRIKDFPSARDAFEKFIDPATSTGNDLLNCYDRWLYKEMELSREGDNLHEFLVK